MSLGRNNHEYLMRRDICNSQECTLLRKKMVSHTLDIGVLVLQLLQLLLGQCI